MPGSAVLGNNLVDSMVPVADSLRGTLNPLFGRRQYRVFITRRSWSGKKRGEGTSTIVSQTEILPVPALSYPDGGNALHKELFPTGLDEEGAVVLSEVSLTYLESELHQSGLGQNEEFYYKVVEGQGQGSIDRFYIPSAPPRPDRLNTIGWFVPLRRVVVVE